MADITVSIVTADKRIVELSAHYEGDQIEHAIEEAIASSRASRKGGLRRRELVVGKVFFWEGEWVMTYRSGGHTLRREMPSREAAEMWLLMRNG